MHIFCKYFRGTTKYLMSSLPLKENVKIICNADVFLLLFYSSWFTNRELYEYKKLNELLYDICTMTLSSLARENTFLLLIFVKMPPSESITISKFASNREFHANSQLVAPFRSRDTFLYRSLSSFYRPRPSNGRSATSSVPEDNVAKKDDHLNSDAQWDFMVRIWAFSYSLCENSPIALEHRRLRRFRNRNHVQRRWRTHTSKCSKRWKIHRLHTGFCFRGCF